jgi:hypothetical protein
MRSTYGLTDDFIYKELSCKIDSQMNMRTQKGAQKALQKERRQEKIINEIMRFDDGNDLATKLDLLSSLEVQESEADGLEVTKILCPEGIAAEQDCAEEKACGGSESAAQKPLKSKKERLLNFMLNEEDQEDPKFDFGAQTRWAIQHAKVRGRNRRSSEDFEGSMLTDLLSMKRSRNEEEYSDPLLKKQKVNTASELQPQPSVAISRSTPKPSTLQPAEDKRNVITLYIYMYIYICMIKAFTNNKVDRKSKRW